jgi:putative FmdB family regulatory protein
LGYRSRSRRAKGFGYNLILCRIPENVMPIYAYRCTDCGFEKDVMRKVSDPLLTTCPECKTENFAKQLTAPGFQLKGNGWYATDFKGGAAAKPAAKSDNPPPCQGGTGSCAANS